MGVLSDFGDRVELEEARQHVRDVTRKSGSSFVWAIRRLDFSRREAMYAVYAFCREVDDIADNLSPVDDKQEKLSEWRREIDRVFDADPVTSTGRALARIVNGYGMSKQDFKLVIDGMMTDAQPIVRMETMDDLVIYTDQVAGAVGRLSNCIFGVERAESLALASALGEALQLTNILRDLDEDARRDRLYLPRDLLAQHGIRSQVPAEVLSTHAVSDVCNDLADRAYGKFDESLVVLNTLNPARVRPARMMLHAYLLQLGKLQERGWHPPRQTVRPTMFERLWVVLRHGYF